MADVLQDTFVTDFDLPAGYLEALLVFRASRS